MSDFVECSKCRAKPGTPVLCADCLRRRAERVEDVSIEVEVPASDPLNLQLGAVSFEVKRRFDVKRMVGPLSYQISHSYVPWSWNPFKGFRGPTVRVWRAWFRYRSEGGTVSNP